MTIPIVDFEKLRTFYVCAKTGKFNIAAQELDVDNSTISRQIQALERQFNCELIERGGFNGLRLTEKGKILYEYTIQIFEKVAQIEPALMHTDEGLNGTLKIWVHNGLCLNFLSSCLDEFAEKHPEIQFEVISTPDPKDVVLREVDVAIGHNINNIINNLEKNEAMIEHPLFSYCSKLYAHKKYLEKHGFPKDVPDLKKHAFISASFSSSRVSSIANWYLELEPGTKLKPYFLSDSHVMLKSFLKRGLGIASISPRVLPLIFTEEERKDILEILPEIMGPNITVSMAYSTSFKDSSKVKILYKFLKEKSLPFCEK